MMGPAGGKGNGKKAFTFSPTNSLVTYFPVFLLIFGLRLLFLRTSQVSDSFITVDASQEVFTSQSDQPANSSPLMVPVLVANFSIGSPILCSMLT